LDHAIARALVASFLNRLHKEGDHFQIPGSTLSKDEVEAFSELAGVAVAVEVQQPTPVVADAKLNLAAFTRPPIPEETLRLCLDFGAAMSKAWACQSSSIATLPLVLGKQADGQAVLAVPSSIFITKAGTIFFGNAAERQHEAEIHTGRYRFDNIKRLLSEVAPDLNISEIPLTDGIDPTGSGLTKGDLLVLYLAWLTDLTLKALADTMQADAAELATKYPDLRSPALIGLRPPALHACARAQARRLAQRRALQGLGAAGRDGTCAAQAHRCRRRQSTNGRYPQRRSDRRLSAVEAACAEAIAHGVHSADVVLNILARQRDPGPPATILTPAALPLRHALGG
jgi:hypothetical protein